MSTPSAPAAADSSREQTLAFIGLLAGGCSIAFAPVFLRSSDAREARVPPLALAGAGLFFAADLGVWHFSILFTSVANSTLLANLAPIFVTLAGWLLWKQRFTRTF